MIGCLRTRVRKQPIIELYFAFKNEPRGQDCRHCTLNEGVTYDFQLSGILTSVDSNEPV